MNSRNSSFLIYLLLFIAIITMIMRLVSISADPEAINLNQVAADIKARQVMKIETTENELTITYKDGTEKTSTKEPESTLIDQLILLGVTQE